MSGLRCQTIGCGSDTLTQLVRESPGGLKLIHCDSCGRDSVLIPENKAYCAQCGGVGVHKDGCGADRPWAV